MKVTVGLSNHHVHLTKEDADVLFGKDYELTVKRPLKQLGQFACEETVDVIINGVKLEHLRIIGPYRNYTQVELIERDSQTLGIKSLYSDSGKLEKTYAITLIGPIGMVNHDVGAFIANNHVHMSSEDLKLFGVQDKELVTIKTNNGNEIKNVYVKSDPSCVLEFHIGKDDGEKLGLQNGDEVEVVKQ